MFYVVSLFIAILWNILNMYEYIYLYFIICGFMYCAYYMVTSINPALKLAITVICMQFVCLDIEIVLGHLLILVSENRRQVPTKTTNRSNLIKWRNTSFQTGIATSTLIDLWFGLWKSQIYKYYIKDVTFFDQRIMCLFLWEKKENVLLCNVTQAPMAKCYLILVARSGYELGPCIFVVFPISLNCLRRCCRTFSIMRK